MKTIESSPEIRFGIRAHDLGCFDADELASRVAAAGFECVQLAIGKAIKGLDPRQTGINAAMAGEIGAAFARHQVRIEVLACYINPIHPEPETRRSLLDLFKQHLRHACAFGSGIVALESGSLNGDYSPHPGNHSEEAFQQLLPVMRELVAEAQQCGVVVGIEAVTSHVVSTPEKMRRLLDEIASPFLKVVFDPVNLLNANNFTLQREVIHRSLELFGDEIIVVHAKDFRVTGDQCEACPAGLGMLNYDAFMPWFARHKPGIAVLLEEAGPEAAPTSRQSLINSIVSNIP